MPRAPNNRTHSADDAAGLRKAAEDLDPNPSLGDAQSWLEWAYAIMDEAATAMKEIEEERDELKAKVDAFEQEPA